MLLLDEQLPPALADFPTDLGVEAIHVRALDLKEAPDESIWLIAASKGWTVMSKDSDFLQIAMSSRHGRFILFGLGDASTRVLRNYILDHLPQIQDFIRSESRIMVLPKRFPGLPDP